MREKMSKVVLVALVVSFLSGCGSTSTDDKNNQPVIEQATVESMIPEKEEVGNTTEKTVIESKVPKKEEVGNTTEKTVIESEVPKKEEVSNLTEKTVIESEVPKKKEVGNPTEEVAIENEVPSEEETESEQESDTHTHIYVSHVLKEASCIEYGTEELTCECGYSFIQEIPMKLHIAGDWIVVEAATYDKEGTRAQFCIGCNSILATEPIAKAICEHDYKIVESVSATCTQKGVTTYGCSNCDSTYSVEQEANGHDFEKTRTVEATCTQKGAVYKICKDCNHEEQTTTLELKEHEFIANSNKESVEATCTKDGRNYYICSACGYEKEEIVTKGHAWNDGKITIAPTCVSSGTKTYSCGNCQDTKTEEIQALEHDYVETERKGTACEEVIIYRCSRENCGNEKQTAVNPQAHVSDDERIIIEASCTTDGKKVKVCSVCGVDVGEEIVISATGHNYGEWQIVTEATCNSEGSKTKSCNNCLDVQTEAISVLQHTEDEWKVEKTASCTEEGLKVLHCKECDTILNTQSIAKEAHSYTELVETKEATCIENGYELYRCSGCDETEKQNIPATGHNAGKEIITPATDLVEGSVKQNCTECGTLIKDEVIEKLPHTHDYAEEISRQDSTCSTEGYVTYKCACGETKQEVLETTEHDEGTWGVTVEATCTRKGSKVRKCNGCNTVLETEEIPVIAHTYGEWKEDGNIRYKECTVCGDKVEEEIPEVHTHSYEEISRVVASCTKAGSVTYKCTGCEDTYTDDIEAIGHTAGEWEVIVEATYTTDGTQEKHCTVCGELLETETIPTLDLGIDSIYYVTLRDGTQEAVIGHYDREAAAEMLVLVNQYRVENGFGELTIDSYFQEAADKRGYESAHTWEHTRPSGGSASVTYGYWSENLATGSNDAELVLEAWQNSEGHNNNILYDYLGTGMGYDYTGLSCFCKRTDYGYEYYWVQVFH